MLAWEDYLRHIGHIDETVRASDYDPKTISNGIIRFSLLWRSPSLLPQAPLMAGEQQMHKAHMKIQLLVGTHEMSVQAQTPGVLICCSARLIGRTEKWVFAVEWQWLLPWQAVNSWKGHLFPVCTVPPTVGFRPWLELFMTVKTILVTKNND